MLTTTKKLLLAPALRITRRHPARTAASGTEGLHWYLCQTQGAFHHLVLLDGAAQLAHWILPAEPALAAATDLLAGLWTQVPPTLGLAAPDATQASGRGTCRAVGTSRPAFAVAPGTLPTSSFLLHLGAAGAAELYTLRQLRPGGQGWLLSKAPCPGQAITLAPMKQPTECKPLT
jgi:hypothetical protein